MLRLLVVLGVLFFVAKVFGGRMMRSLFLMPFRMKGAALRGALVEVQSVAPIAPPVVGTAAHLKWFLVEVKVTPSYTHPADALATWEPGELRLVRASHAVGPDAPDDPSFAIGDLEIEQHGAFQPDEGMKYVGPQRLRMKVGAAPEAAGLPAKFQYYFEAFGEVYLNIPSIC